MADNGWKSIQISRLPSVADTGGSLSRAIVHVVRAKQLEVVSSVLVRQALTEKGSAGRYSMIVGSQATRFRWSAGGRRVDLKVREVGKGGDTDEVTWIICLSFLHSVYFTS